MYYMWKMTNNETGEIKENYFLFSSAREARNSAHRYIKYHNWKREKTTINIPTLEILLKGGNK